MSKAERKVDALIKHFGFWVADYGSLFSGLGNAEVYTTLGNANPDDQPITRREFNRFRETINDQSNIINLLIEYLDIELVKEGSKFQKKSK